MLRILLIAIIAAVSLPAATLEIFACEPEWAALARELAGADASIVAATTASQDPHRLQARPSLIAAVRHADLLICTGADLEIGWLPLLLRRAGNRAIQPGNPGHVLAADFVRKLELPTRIDRSEGDVHPQGNPHVHLNPHNLSRVARALSERLVRVDPENTADYRARLEDFMGRWETAIGDWEHRGARLAGLRLVSHHRAFSYLADWLDIDIVANIEVKPGIPPTTSHLAWLLESLQADPPAAIIRTPYTDERPSLWLSTRLDAPAIPLPYTVGGRDSEDLFQLFESTLAALDKVAR